jgi:hypothetical protein
MRRIIHRCALLALSAGLLAACGKPQDNADAPLAFAPADTPYAYANLEPTPTGVTEQWSKHMQEYMPEVLSIYDHLLDQASKDGKPEAARFVKIARVLLGELKTHDNWDKLRQIGLKPDARMALYGVGLVPVLRMELGDPAAFRAEIANIEQKVGEKLPVAKSGTQEYWQIGNDKLVCVVAIEGSHLVLTVLPPNAPDALTQSLLGLTRPAQNLGAAGTLQALAKQYNYSPYGEGFFDLVRLTERLSSAPQGTDAQFATALGLPVPAAIDPVCKSEFLQIVHNFPRVVVGAEEINAQRLSISAELEIEAGLAQEIASAIGAAPGTGASADGIVDISVALPLLKLKDFWIKQADKIAAKPFACPELKELNEGYAQSKTKVDVTIPPPASDLTGARFTLDKIELGATPGGMPDVAGKLLLTSNNPVALVAMAQLAVPQLKDLKLAPDGKAVALPAGLVPSPKAPPLFAAMSDKAIAIGAGAGEDAALGAYLKAAPANEAVFLRMSFSGKLYALIAQSAEKMKAMLPDDQKTQWDQQKKLFAMYEKWLKRGEISFIANKNGVAIRETIEQN